MTTCTMHADRIWYKFLMQSSHQKHMYKHNRTSAMRTPAVHRKTQNSLRHWLPQFQEPQSYVKQDWLHTLRQQHRQVHQVPMYSIPAVCHKCAGFSSLVGSCQWPYLLIDTFPTPAKQCTAACKTPTQWRHGNTPAINFQTSPSDSEQCDKDLANWGQLVFQWGGDDMTGICLAWGILHFTVSLCLLLQSL